MPKVRQAAAILCAYTLLAAIYTSPVLQQSQSRIASDPYDPILNTSILWWNATTIPFSEQWWNPPYFYPATGVSAFTENLVGVSLFASPVYWLTTNPLAAYNIAFFLTWPLSAFAVYLLAYFLIRRHDAAILAGLSYGFTPYRTAELGHLQMLSSYWLPVCVLALHGFLEERRARWLVVFGIAWILQALANGYFIFFGAVLIGLWLLYFCSTRDNWRAAPAIVVTWAIASLPLLPIMLKYQAIHEHYGLRRTMSEVLWFSAPVTAWWEVSQLIKVWGGFLPESKDNLFPGVTVVVLALAGVGLARWKRPAVARSRRQRIALAVLGLATLAGLSVIAFTLMKGPWSATLMGIPIRVTNLDRAAAVALCCGGAFLLIKTRLLDALRTRPAFIFYVVATLVLAILCLGPAIHTGDTMLLDPLPYRYLMYLPGFDQLRVPTRFWMVGTMCLGVAAALTFARYVPPRQPLRLILFAVIAAGILADGWTRGIPMATAPVQWLRIERRDRTEPIIELPLGPPWDAAATFRGLRHRRGVANGVSGYDPPAYAPLQDALNSRDPEILLALASLGPIEVIVNGAEDSDGSLMRYVSSVPGAELTGDDGQRRSFRVTAPARSEIVLGPSLQIAGVRASSEDSPDPVLDRRIDTEWHDSPQQLPGHFLIADLGSLKDVGGVTMSLGEWARDFPRRLAIDVSSDGSTWDRVWEGNTAAMTFLAATRAPRECALRFAFDVRAARLVRLKTLVAHKNLWRIAEIQVHSPSTAR
jgi:hypothetical protein